MKCLAVATFEYIRLLYFLTPLQPATPCIKLVVYYCGSVVLVGAATLNAPRSEVEIKRNMAILNDHNTMAIPIRFLIPNSIDGQVR